MYQLVLKDGQVVATHKANVDLDGKYPLADEIILHHTYPEITDDGFGPDPRTDEERRNSYISKRGRAYPSITDQLGMMYHDAVDGTTTWRDAITSVRDQYPKPVDEERK